MRKLFKTDGNTVLIACDLPSYSEINFNKKYITKLRSKISEAITLLGNRGTTLSLLLTSDEKIKELNKKWRGIDKSTNIITFPARNIYKGYQIESPEDKILGDIVISLEQTKKDAKKSMHTLFEEVLYLSIHGLLHIEGMTHENEKERKAMLAREKSILEMLNTKTC